MMSSIRGRRCALIGAALSISAAAAGAQTTNWRDFETLSFGRVRALAQISSARTIRLITAIDNSHVIGPEIPADSLLKWERGLWNDLDNPKPKYELANALMVQPFAADSVTIGYLLTVADTSGDAKQAILDKGAIEEFLDLLSNAATAVNILSESELKKNSPIVTTPVTLAKPYAAVYPRTAKLVGLSGKAVIQFVVDTTGKAKPETITTVEATFKDFGDAAASYVKEMAFTPASIDGHPVERLVQYPFDFKLNAVLPISPFLVPVRRGR